MSRSSVLSVLSFLSLFVLTQGLTPYTGEPPTLPERTPFGFGSSATGGAADDGTNTYLVDNMPDLRTALKMDMPRIVYVKGEIQANEINASFSGDCQWYIDTSPNPNFNFTQYIQAYNETYMDEVEAAADAGEEIDGYDAATLLDLLKHQNGWRSQVQNVQKSYEAIDVESDLTLVGWDADAWLHGVNLGFNTQQNIIVRNLKLTSPRDCFPSPETYPGSWNARYDAISMVTSHDVWIDGNIFEDGPQAVAPEDFIWGWEVDRYDGLFDAEDGTDNVTFSHNVVANHHKSLLWGGGEKEGPLDLGKMHFTVFGNHFVNSLSRNPLMRFGTFYVVNNLYENYENEAPRFDVTSTSSSTAATADNSSYTPDFQYNLGIYNLSHVLLSGNYFAQSGEYPDDASRIFAFSDLETPDMPAQLCSPADLSDSELAEYPQLANLTLKSQLNGVDVDLADNAMQTLEYYVENEDNVVEGGLSESCEGFVAQDLPKTFDSATEVESYVRENAGQVGQTEP